MFISQQICLIHSNYCLDREFGLKENAVLELVLQQDFQISQFYDYQVMISFSATQQSRSLTLIPGSCPTLRESLRLEMASKIIECSQ